MTDEILNFLRVTLSSCPGWIYGYSHVHHAWLSVSVTSQLIVNILLSMTG